MRPQLKKLFRDLFASRSKEEDRGSTGVACDDKTHARPVRSATQREAERDTRAPRPLSLDHPPITAETPSLMDTDINFFGRLPLEVRQIIYIHHFKGFSRTVHIVRKQAHRMGHFRCKDGACNEDRDPCWGQYDEYGDWVPGSEHPVTEGGNLSLLLVCKNIYLEAIPLLYCTPRFEFRKVSDFLTFATTIHPIRLNQIREVFISSQLEFKYIMPVYGNRQRVLPHNAGWESTIETLSGMEGLRVLHFWLYLDGHSIMSLEQERGLLKPFNVIDQTRSFLVEAKWAVDRADDGDGYRSFKLEHIE